LFQQTFKNLTPLQRRELIIAIVRLGAIGLLSWGCVSNILSAGVLSLAWTRTSLLMTAAAAAAGGAQVPIFPWMVVDSTIWRTFLASYTTLKFILDPFLLIAKGCGTLLLFQFYIHCITTIERKWMPTRLRLQYPLLFRLGALATAFILSNVIMPTVTAGVGLGVGGVGVRLLRRWFPIIVS
jgi:hypothetical protein